MRCRMWSCRMRCNLMDIWNTNLKHQWSMWLGILIRMLSCSMLDCRKGAGCCGKMCSAIDCCMMCNWDHKADTPRLDWRTSLSGNLQCSSRWPSWTQFCTRYTDCMMNSWNSWNCKFHIICLYPPWHKFPMGKLSNIAQELWLFLLLQLSRYFASTGTCCYDINNMY